MGASGLGWMGFFHNRYILTDHMNLKILTVEHIPL